MTRISLIIASIFLATSALAKPTTVEVDEVPDAFNSIPLTKVWWAKNTPEWENARIACGGGNPVFVDWRREGRALVHIAECR